MEFGADGLLYATIRTTTTSLDTTLIRFHGVSGAPMDTFNIGRDSNTDRVYQYNNAVSRTSGSQAASTSFVLAAGNTNPQGIADPPVARSSESGRVAAAAAKESRGRAAAHDAALFALMSDLDLFSGGLRKKRR